MELKKDRYKEIYENVKAYVSKLTPDKDQADELTQEVFLKAHDSIGALRGHDKLVPWLRRIAYNTIIDHHRKKKTVPFITDLPADDDISNEGNEELMKCITRMLEDLPETDRNLLDAIEIKGMTQVEYAQKYNLTVSTVKSRIQRAKQKIKIGISGNCFLVTDLYGNVVAHNPPTGLY